MSTKTSEAYRDLESTLIEKFKSEDFKIPVIPEFAGKVVALAHKDDVSIEEVAEILERDPVIAGYVLRVANSPNYNSSEEITSLNQASSRLGINLLSEIAISVSMNNNVFITKGYHEMMLDILRHTMACVILSKELVHHFDFDADRMYLSSLFHTSGMPIILYIAYERKLKAKIEFTDRDLIYALAKFQSTFTRKVLDHWGVKDDVKFISTRFMNYTKVEAFKLQTAFLSMLKRVSNWIFSDQDASVLNNLDELKFLNVDPSIFSSIIENKLDYRRNISKLVKFK